MKNMQLHPGILWGQHRSSELIAMDVKERLENDPDIKKLGLPFIEFEKWTIDDYISLLFHKRDALERGVKEGTYEDQRKEFTLQVLEYQESLREKYGPLLFNLHDGVKWLEMAPFDLEFRIPCFIEDSERLKNYLSNVSERHKLKLCMSVYHHNDRPGLVSPNNVVVEFLTPEPERLMNYPSEEVRKLAEKFDPTYASCSRYKVSNVYDILHRDTVERYANFMKDMLMGLGQLKIK